MCHLVLRYVSQCRLWKLLTCGEKTLLIYIGSSRGRGTRAAGWFADRIEEQGESGLKSLVLGGGIKGWAGAGSEYTEWMEGYEEAVWKV